MKKPGKLTQKRAVFYLLLKAEGAWIPAWKFVGEIDIPELGTTFFMSYKCPANGVDVFHKNPGLIERERVTGKSGARYYQYRIAQPLNEDLIQEADMKEFYQLITAVTI